MKIKYLDEINAFSRWLTGNPIPAPARLLWYTIMQIGNETGWKDTLYIPISTLVSRSGLSSAGVRRARKVLHDNGLVLYESRGGSRSASYKIVPFPAQFVIQKAAPIVAHNEQQKNVKNIVAHNEQQTEQQTEHIYKSRVDKSRVDTLSTVERNRYIGAAAIISEAMKEGFGQPSAIITEMIADDANTYGNEWCMQAMKIAVGRNVRKWNYCHGILKKWEREYDKTAKPWEIEEAKSHAGSTQYDAGAEKNHGRITGKIEKYGNPDNLDWDNLPDPEW